jgi:hypothetical protein
LIYIDDGLLDLGYPSFSFLLALLLLTYKVFRRPDPKCNFHIILS